MTIIELYLSMDLIFGMCMKGLEYQYVFQNITHERQVYNVIKKSFFYAIYDSQELQISKW